MRHPIGPLAPLRSVWRNRHLVLQMAERDARARYRGSAAGVMWVAIHPLLMLAVYTFFFTEVVPMRWSQGADTRGAFALALFIGLLLHAFISEVLGRAPLLIVGNPNLVKKVVFPLDVLPVISVATALFHFAVGFAIWFVFYLTQYGLPPITAWWLPVVVAPLALLAVGLCWLLASLGVYLRDISQVVPVFTAVLLFVSPIFYPLSTLREPFRTLALGSPLSVPIEQARLVLLDGKVPEWQAVAVYSLVAVTIAYLGFAWFQATRKGFADVL